MNISVVIDQLSANEQAALDIILAEANAMNERAGLPERFTSVEEKFARDIREQIGYHAKQVSSPTLIDESLKDLPASDQREVISVLIEKAAKAGKSTEHLNKRLGLLTEKQDASPNPNPSPSTARLK